MRQGRTADPTSIKVSPTEKNLLNFKYVLEARPPASVGFVSHPLADVKRGSTVVRHRIKFVLAAFLAAATAFTALVPDWIEGLLHVDPDGGTGTLEFAILGALALLTAITLLSGVRDYRRVGRPERLT